MLDRKERLRQVTELETKIFTLRDDDGKFSIDSAEKLLKHLANKYVHLKKDEWDAYLIDISENFDAPPPPAKRIIRTAIHEFRTRNKKGLYTLVAGDVPDIIREGLGELSIPDDAKFKVILKSTAERKGKWEIQDKGGNAIYELQERKESIGVFESNKK